jgi:acylphosphatase
MNSTSAPIQPDRQDADMETRRVQVYGRVQGVGFRYATVEQARQLAVCGWVRNRIDGSVEATIQGSAPQLDRMQAWLAHGPRNARVDRLQTQAVDHAPVYPTFTQYPDA